MAGIIQSAQQTAAQGAPSQGGERETGNPEQSAANSLEAYDVAAGQMLSFVYDQQGVAALTQLVQASDPATGMARLFGRLLVMTTQSAVLAGKRVAPALVFQAGIEVIRALSEVAQKEGLIDPANEKEIAETAFYDGIALFATEAKEEALTADEREQYAILLQKAEEMERQAQGGMPQGEPEQQSQEVLA